MAGFHLGGGNGGDEDDGVAAADGDGAIGEFGNFAGFERHRVGADVGRECMDIHSLYLFSFFSAYGPCCGMQNGHSSFFGKNPQRVYWRAAEGPFADGSGGISGARAVSRNSYWVCPVAVLQQFVGHRHHFGRGLEHVDRHGAEGGVGGGCGGVRDRVLAFSRVRRTQAIFEFALRALMIF